MLESSRKHSANSAGCNFAMWFTLTSHQGKLHFSNRNIAEKSELREKKKRRNINLPLLLFSESNSRKSQLQGLEAPSCYSSLETSRIRYRNSLNGGGGLLRAHPGGHGLFPQACPCRELRAALALALALLCCGMPWADGLMLRPVQRSKCPRCRWQGLGHCCVPKHKYCSGAAREPAIFPLRRSRLSLSEVTDCGCQLSRSSTNQSLAA